MQTGQNWSSHDWMDSREIPRSKQEMVDPGHRWMNMAIATNLESHIHEAINLEGLRESHQRKNGFTVRASHGCQSMVPQSNDNGDLGSVIDLRPNVP